MRQNPKATDGLAPQALSARARCGDACARRVGAAAAHSAPARLQRCPDRAALRRCSRIRGLPDADDARIRTPRTTPGTRLHPVNSALLANSEVAPETAVPCGRDATVEPRTT